MEINWLLPNHKWLLLGFHSCNEGFIKKKTNSLRGNWEGRKALTYLVLSAEENVNSLTNDLIFFLAKLQEGVYWLDLAQMN